MNTFQSEIHKLLGLGGEDQSHISGAPAGLPIFEQGQNADSGSQIAVQGHAHTSETTMSGINNITLPQIKFKSLLIYPAIFLTAFIFFYVVLNISSLWAQVEGFFSKPQSQEILGADSEAYYKWIGNYFYAVGDKALLEPTNDIDKDGLSNHDEFVMRTNPILADSDSDGFTDGIEVINSFNPWGEGAMTSSQRTLAEKLDVILINNRVSGNIAENQGTVGGAATSNYDLDRPGRLSIPKLKLQVLLIWSKTTDDFDHDLTQGVIHYPGTALPGENGIVYVSGHSSDYIWKKDPMANIFTKLNYLTAGDDVFIDVYGKDGKVYNFRYKVSTSHVYKANDQQQFFENTDTSKLNLSTCWPIGTSKDRLVVTAEATGL
ncbi:MAG: class E sortase [Candidatus Doudnabacteria bacterium]|nr:class E sortase [Candidatus Doudnabacteria bacterium]